MTAFVREHCVSLTVPHPAPDSSQGLGVLPASSTNSPNFLLPVWADPTSAKFHQRDHVVTPWKRVWGTRGMCLPALLKELNILPTTLFRGRGRFSALARALPPMSRQDQLSHAWSSTCQVYILTSVAQECLCPDCHLAAVCPCTKHLTSLSFQAFTGT